MKKSFQDLIQKSHEGSLKFAERYQESDHETPKQNSEKLLMSPEAYNAKKYLTNGKT